MAVVDPQPLPDPVAEHEAGVEDRDHRLGARLQLAVDPDQDLVVAGVVGVVVGARWHAPTLGVPGRPCSPTWGMDRVAKTTLSGLDHSVSVGSGGAMSRVFVSCAYRDRAVGSARRGGSSGPWATSRSTTSTSSTGERPGGTPSSTGSRTHDVFLAVVSPAYAEAQSCRLAAKHAAARGLPVVRARPRGRRDGLPPGGRPGDAGALRPRRPEAAWRLADALGAAAPDAREAPCGRASPPPGPGGPPRSRSSPPARAAGSGIGEPSTTTRLPARPRGVEVVLVAIVLLVAVGLVAHRGRRPPGRDRPPAADPAPAQPGAPTHGRAGGGPGPRDPGARCRRRGGFGPAAGLVVRGRRRPGHLPRPGVEHPGGRAHGLPDAAGAVRRLHPRGAAAVRRPGAGATRRLHRSAGRGRGQLEPRRRPPDRHLGRPQVLGGLDPASEAAGRVFCTESSDVVRARVDAGPGPAGDRDRAAGRDHDGVVGPRAPQPGLRLRRHR